MKKIRINELARELEVKPGIILDLLPELGVQEKKTHSSSIEEDTAIALRERLAESGFLGSFPNRANGHHDGDESEPSSTDAASGETVHTEAPEQSTSSAAASAETVRPPVASAPAQPSSLSQRSPLRSPTREPQTHTESSPRGIGIPPVTAPVASGPAKSAPVSETAPAAPPPASTEPER